MQRSPTQQSACATCSSPGQPYQVKRSRNGFRLVYEGLRNVAGLFVWADGRERLAVVTCRTIVRFTRWRMRARAVLRVSLYRKKSMYPQMAFAAENR